MPVYEISGRHNEGNSNVSLSGATKMIEVDPWAAESNFLVMVNLDLFKYKTLLRSNEAILYGPVKDWYERNGFDFNQLLLVLNA